MNTRQKSIITYIKNISTGEIPPDFEVPVTQKSEKVITDHGTSKVESVWKCTVVDTAAVPRNFCTPDQGLLDAAVITGVREIPGCKIEEVFDTKIRLSKKRYDSEFVF